MTYLKTILIALIVMAPMHLLAQDEEAEPEAATTIGEGFSLLRDGVEILLKDFLRELEPAFKELDALLDDLESYEAPIVLPNGDILIKRKTPLDVLPPLEAPPDTEDRQPEKDDAPQEDHESIDL